MKRTFRISLVLLAILALVACSKGATKSGQVVAKVNGEEITIHQVNAAMPRLGVGSEAQAKEASKQVLNSLIEQQLLLKKAIDAKLDRDPGVVQAIENAKRQILAQFYLDKLSQSVSKPSDNEVHDYYAKHPELFEKRRVYRFQELLFENKPETLKIAKTTLEQGKSIRDLGHTLQSERIPFQANETVKISEQLPMDMLARVSTMKVGQGSMVASDKSLLVMYLVDVRPLPVTEEQAKPAIESYLMNTTRAQLAQAEVKKLHDTAKIEYLGAFAGAGTLAQANSSTPIATSPALDKGSAKADKDAIEKGLSGLK